ncbi:hypothetical protein PIB30_026286 [Stylosanthes scabra]|uniref:Uncharacterized protein n=1 Tax=Stylosanthes scabra TaxID=79078 RepID=A0ABU6U969_9FABA|nr:hypothetical protein [Stylosanthes scabra]
MPTSLGISETRNWRIGGEDERLNMRTAMDCAWVLDGAIKDRVCALSLASRNRNGWIEPEGRDDERNEIVMV